ncbi:MAG: tetratricopeptide repeat protein [Thermomicrobiales bacterium]
MPVLMALVCPVCGAPLSQGDTLCAFCGSAIFIKADAPQLNLRNLNQTVIQEHIGDFRTRIRSDRYDVEAHYGLGMAYYSLGLGDEAIEELTHAAKLMPENADIQTQLAVVLHRSVLSGNAAAEKPMRERLAKALTLDPTNFEANLLRADIMQRRGDYAGALGTIRPVVSGDPARGNAKRAEILVLLGRQALRDDDTAGFTQIVAELRQIDQDAAARDLLLLSLQAHRDDLGPAVIIAPGGGSATMAKDFGDRAASIGKTIFMALGTLGIGFFILMIAAVALPKDSQDSMTGTSTAIFGVVFLLWLASPFVAGWWYRRRIRTHAPKWDTRLGTRIPRDDVLAGRASTDDLIAAERLARVDSVPQRPGTGDGVSGSKDVVGHSAGTWFDSNA